MKHQNTLASASPVLAAITALANRITELSGAGIGSHSSAANGERKQKMGQRNVNTAGFRSTPR